MTQSEKKQKAINLLEESIKKNFAKTFNKIKRLNEDNITGFQDDEIFADDDDDDVDVVGLDAIKTDRRAKSLAANDIKVGGEVEDDDTNIGVVPNDAIGDEEVDDTPSDNDFLGVRYTNSAPREDVDDPRAKVQQLYTLSQEMFDTAQSIGDPELTNDMIISATKMREKAKALAASLGI